MPINYTKHPDYDALPTAVKWAMSGEEGYGVVSKEYAYLPEPLKRTLVDDMCAPDEPEEDWEPGV